jgi:hypothetical protein
MACRPRPAPVRPPFPCSCEKTGLSPAFRASTGQKYAETPEGWYGFLLSPEQGSFPVPAITGKRLMQNREACTRFHCMRDRRIGLLNLHNIACLKSMCRPFPFGRRWRERRMRAPNRRDYPPCVTAAAKLFRLLPHHRPFSRTEKGARPSACASHVGPSSSRRSHQRALRVTTPLRPGIVSPWTSTPRPAPCAGTERRSPWLTKA